MAFFICTNCGFGSASWMGKCPDCGQWNTLVEKPEFDPGYKSKDKKTLKKISITSLGKIKSNDKKKTLTQIFEFDRVLGGGITNGAVILLTGEPGIGKSTLLLQSLKNFKPLYISGEESAEQVKQRAERLHIPLDNISFSNDTQIEGILASAEEIKDEIDILIIDSIQTVYSKDIDSQSGSVNQLKEVAKKIIYFSKATGIPAIIIGHITKDGDVAGPKTLEHLVDCVITFEGDKTSLYRLLRANKNRFGGTDEIGIFEMTEKGLIEVSGPTVFINNQSVDQPGKVIVGTIEGTRPIFYEIQTLVVPTMLPVPRRVVKGLDYNKTLLLLAVVRKHLKIPLDNYDIYVNVIGGVSIKSTSSDLGLIASLMASYKNISLPHKSLFIGEVGLLGEVRPVYFEPKITKEAIRLGYKKIVNSTNISNVKSLFQFFK